MEPSTEETRPTAVSLSSSMVVTHGEQSVVFCKRSEKDKKEDAKEAAADDGDREESLQATTKRIIRMHASTLTDFSLDLMDKIMTYINIVRDTKVISHYDRIFDSGVYGCMKASCDSTGEQHRTLLMKDCDKLKELISLLWSPIEAQMEVVAKQTREQYNEEQSLIAREEHQKRMLQEKEDREGKEPTTASGALRHERVLDLRDEEQMFGSTKAVNESGNQGHTYNLRRRKYRDSNENPSEIARSLLIHEEEVGDDCACMLIPERKRRRKASTRALPCTAVKKQEKRRSASAAATRATKSKKTQHE